MWFIEEYKGYEICGTAYPDLEPYYVQTYKDGLPWHETECPRFDSVEEARDWIDDLPVFIRMRKAVLENMFIEKQNLANKLEKTTYLLSKLANMLEDIVGGQKQTGDEHIYIDSARDLVRNIVHREESNGND